MKRRIGWLLILLILAAFAVWLEPTRFVWAWLRGEEFYDCRPVSWWMNEIESWEFKIVVKTDPDGQWEEMHVNFYEFDKFEKAKRILYYRTCGPIEKAMARVFGQPGDEHIANVLTDPALLRGDPAAEPILNILAESTSPKIRFFAKHGIINIKEEKKIPWTWPR